MANPVWPPGLPQYPTQDNLQSSFEDATIRTQTDHGPERVRQRYANPVERVPGVKYLFTAAEYAIFKTFFKSTLKNGSKKYDHLHPIERTSATLRLRGPYTILVKSYDCYLVSINVDVMP